MISENLAQLFSNLKKDNVSFFSEKWEDISNHPDIKENFLSYCLEEKAFKVFDFALSKGLTDIRSIILANAIRSNNKKIIELIETNLLLKYDSKKATDLLSIAVSNNDKIVIDFLIEKVQIAHDILNFALISHNKEFLHHFINLNYDWSYAHIEQNPVIFIIENFLKDKKEFIKICVENSKHKNKIINEATFYFKKSEYEKILNDILSEIK